MAYVVVFCIQESENLHNKHKIFFSQLLALFNCPEHNNMEPNNIINGLTSLDQ